MKQLYRIVWAVAFLAAIVWSGMSLAFAPYMAPFAIIAMCVIAAFNPKEA